MIDCSLKDLVIRQDTLIIRKCECIGYVFDSGVEAVLNAYGYVPVFVK